MGEMGKNGRWREEGRERKKEIQAGLVIDASQKNTTYNEFAYNEDRFQLFHLQANSIYIIPGVPGIVTFIDKNFEPQIF
jgi:hypothetical protein